jgi:hypothetical protein
MLLDWIQKVIISYDVNYILITCIAGESGEHTYISKWKGYDITFHVSALMPLKVNDKQQVLRKSHIGNGIM